MTQTIVAAAARTLVAQVLRVCAADAVQEAPDVMTPPQLALGDNVEPGRNLVLDRQAHRVFHRFLQLLALQAPRGA